MKEIEELKSLSLNCYSFHSKYQWNELNVKKEYDDTELKSIVLDFGWTEDRISFIVFFFCNKFFQEEIKQIVNKVEEKIENSMESAFSTTQKTDFLKSKVSHLIEINFRLLDVLSGFEKPKIGLSMINKTINGFIKPLKPNYLSPLELIEDAFKVSQIVLNANPLNAKKFLDKLTIYNILNLACEGALFEIQMLINRLSINYSDYINEQDFSRIIKKYKREENITKITRKGRPKLAEEKRTLIDIWINDEISFNDVLTFLKSENAIEEDEIFVLNINGISTWQKVHLKHFGKYIQGFLFVCLKNELIESKIASRTFQTIFFNTFNFKLSDKSFVERNILDVESKYSAPFEPIKKLIKNVSQK